MINRRLKICIKWDYLVSYSSDENVHVAVLSFIVEFLSLNWSRLIKTSKAVLEGSLHLHCHRPLPKSITNQLTVRTTTVLVSIDEYLFYSERTISFSFVRTSYSRSDAVSSKAEKMDYWRERSVSTAIPPTLASDVVVRYDRIDGITPRVAFLQALHAASRPSMAKIHRQWWRLSEKMFCSWQLIYPTVLLLPLYL